MERKRHPLEVTMKTHYDKTSGLVSSAALHSGGYRISQMEDTNHIGTKVEAPTYYLAMFSLKLHGNERI